jgi:hypothetical protein
MDENRCRWALGVSEMIDIPMPNIGLDPRLNKYIEGKMKRKREEWGKDNPPSLEGYIAYLSGLITFAQDLQEVIIENQSIDKAFDEIVKDLDEG